MGMFLNYHSISDNYTPNNLFKAFPIDGPCSKFMPFEGSKPYEEYDAKGELEGYYWRYGDTLNLEFCIDGEIRVEDNALVLKTVGEVPSIYTKGYVGQRCYNIRDLLSWTCVGISGRTYIWEQDANFTYPLEGKNSIYVSADEYIKGKSAAVTIYNFRMEPVYRYEVMAVTPLIMPITKDISLTMPKGIYYCSLEISGEDFHQTIFSPQDCKLIVK